MHEDNLMPRMANPEPTMNRCFAADGQEFEDEEPCPQVPPKMFVNPVCETGGIKLRWDLVADVPENVGFAKQRSVRCMGVQIEPCV